jgi:molecular chaperone GrpE
MSDHDTLNPDPRDLLDALDGADTEPDRADAAGEEITDTEADILRTELAAAQTALKLAEAERDELQSKFLRARADLETVRRRASADSERAREAGLDSAVLTVLTVFDDLGRALEVVDENDPSKIVPGVRAVRDSLERSLEALGIVRVGEVGEPFDPDLHEALTALPTENPEQSETIAQVFQAGFRRGDRLVRPARVVVFQSR